MPASRPRPSVVVHAIAQTVGVGLVGLGAWMAWHPAGFIAWGLGVVGLSVAAEIAS